MDKESITQFAWIVIISIVMSALMVFATPFGDSISHSFVTLIKGQDKEMNQAYSEEQIKENQNYMENLFDVTHMQESGLYEHGDASKYTYSWAELRHNNIITISDSRASMGANGNKLSGDLIIDDHITTISNLGSDELNSVRLGEFTRAVEAHCFIDAIGLKTFISSVNLQYIGDYAFAYCENLENVYLNSGLKTIAEGAFYDCPKLKVIHFDGTKQAWNNISKGSSSLGTVEKIICNDGEIVLN